MALTPAAAELLVKLTGLHGSLMFHQSGGCCDGGAPMCGLAATADPVRMVVGRPSDIRD